MKKTNENDSVEDSEEENEEKRNLELYLEDNIDKNIEKKEKKVEKYDKEVKTQIALSKNGQNKEKHKKEAISALKKKKFYEKNLKKLQDKKLTIEIKIMDIDLNYLLVLHYLCHHMNIQKMECQYIHIYYCVNYIPIMV